MIIACTACGLAAVGLRAIQPTTQRVTANQQVIDKQSCRLAPLSAIKPTYEWIAVHGAERFNDTILGMQNIPSNMILKINQEEYAGLFAKSGCDQTSPIASMSLWPDGFESNGPVGSRRISRLDNGVRTKAYQKSVTCWQNAGSRRNISFVNCGYRPNSKSRRLR